MTGVIHSGGDADAGKVAATVLARLRGRDRTLARGAFVAAAAAHRGQKRDEGRPYIVHPVGVARILVEEFGVRAGEVIAAAFLHDTLEDTALTASAIRRGFGQRVARWVACLTKEPKERYRSRSARDAVYHRGVARAPLEARLIKVADRLDNLRTIGRAAGEKQRRYLAETWGFFLPFALLTLPAAVPELVRRCELLAARLRVPLADLPLAWRLAPAAHRQR